MHSFHINRDVQEYLVIKNCTSNQKEATGYRIQIASMVAHLTERSDFTPNDFRTYDLPLLLANLTDNQMALVFYKYLFCIEATIKEEYEE